MKTIKHISAALMGIILLWACQKEFSIESGNTLGGQAAGSLKDTAGNCRPITLKGLYFQDSTLTDSNYVLVQVNITTPGAYIISTDTRNGYSFRDSGYLTTTGLKTLTLKGRGKPITAGTNDFTVSFDTTLCSFSVVVAPSISGPAAVYTLGTTAGACTGAVVGGTYGVGTPLASTNKVDINVNVTTVGSYLISTTTASGITFSSAGTFTTTGAQTVSLTGTGTPTTAGSTTFQLTGGGSTCSFTVPITAAALSNDYFPTSTNSNWSYTLDLTADTLLLTAITSNTTILGNSYRNFKASTDGSNDTMYYRKTTGNYFEFGDIDFIGILDSVYTAVEFPFLKDNVPVGNTWESAEVGATYNSVAGKAKLKFTILAKDVQETINNVVVDSVIRVQRDVLFQPTGGTYTTATTMIYRYAKNKGLLLVTGSLNVAPPPVPAFPYRFEAKRYQIF